MKIFYCLRFETLPVWRARSPYLYPPGIGWPTYVPGTGFPFRRLLRLAGKRWRYSNPPLGGGCPGNQTDSSEILSQSQSQSYFTTWRLSLLASQFWLSADMPQYMEAVCFVFQNVYNHLPRIHPWTISDSYSGAQSLYLAQETGYHD
jgi:hypothetical protein